MLDLCGGERITQVIMLVSLSRVSYSKVKCFLFIGAHLVFFGKLVSVGRGNLLRNTDVGSVEMK